MRTLVFACLILALAVVMQAWSIHRLQERVYALEDAPPTCVELVSW